MRGRRTFSWTWGVTPADYLGDAVGNLHNRMNRLKPGCELLVCVWERRIHDRAPPLCFPPPPFAYPGDEAETTRTWSRLQEGAHGARCLASASSAVGRSAHAGA